MHEYWNIAVNFASKQSLLQNFNRIKRYREKKTEKVPLDIFFFHFHFHLISLFFIILFFSFFFREEKKKKR